MRLNRSAGTLVLAVLLGACASQDGLRARIPPLRDQVVPLVADVDFHSVSPPMKDFLEQNVSMKKSKDQRAWSLVWAITHRDVLAFDYDPGLTLDPQHTFAVRRGNCLAFSSMLVAMARHLGLTAWYQEVEIPPEWYSVNNTLLVTLHINVIVEGKDDQWVVDISGRDSSIGRKIKRITDADALAQYYNNLGADALTQTNLALAHAYFRKAIETKPNLPYLWSNLAVVYNRNDQLQDARESYLVALDIDPGSSIAANNLYMIYEKEGNLEAARKMRSKVERHRRKNPYYLYYLSSQAYQQGRYVESREMLQKAIALKDQEYRFHYELARLLAGEGDRAAAQSSLDRALQLAPENSRISNAQVDDLPPLPE
ncbi:MAG TPA: tetratricopeptide repeat protein [Xanthomonadales bacterium]|nr:tetratricopeptide repeat protein [Xanthomonadales bacterium]